VKVAGTNRTNTIYSGSQVVSELSDASTATYTTGTTPGQAPSDTVALMLYHHTDHMSERVATDQQGRAAWAASKAMNGGGPHTWPVCGSYCSEQPPNPAHAIIRRLGPRSPLLKRS